MEYYKRRRKNPFRFLIWIVVGGIIMYLAFNSYKSSQEENSSDLKKPSASFESAASAVPRVTSSPGILGTENKSSGSLAEVVTSSMEGTKGTYGIVIKNLKTGEAYYSNEHHVFAAGSLYKLWIMGTAYKNIEAGALNEDEVLSEDISDLNDKFDIDPDLAELTDGTITLSVKAALNQMITISHNYAALLLTEKLRLSTVASYLQEKGLNESKVGTNGDSPTTTAADAALFLEKLYQGQLANAQSTGEMLDLLKAQKLNDKLPKYLPDDAVVAHKTGEIDDFSHDAGIVYDPKGDYIIVVLSESDSPAGAEERIAQLSKDVYEYFEGR